MEYIRWHYSYAVTFYLARLASTLSAVSHQFSLSLLLPTLFAPWKRLIVVTKRKGFNPAVSFQEVSFNLISRGIGAVVRLLLFVTGCVALLIVFVSGAVGFVFWIFVPFVSIPLYQVYLRQPAFVMKELTKKGNGKLLRSVFFESDPGKFLLTHVGTVSDAFPEELVTFEANAQTFTELLQVILKNNHIDENVLRQIGVTQDDLVAGASWWDERRRNKTALTPTRALGAGIGRSLIAGYTPTLDQYSTDMGETSFAHHLIGREADVSQMTRSLAVGNGVVLTGAPGVGKKTVVYEFARRAHDGLLGSAMSYKRILDFDYNAAISQTHDVSQKKEILSTIFSEAEQAGNVILMVRDIQRLTNSLAEGIDITDVLSTHLENRKLLLVAVVDREDYDRFLSRNERLKKFLEVITISEMSKEDAFPILLSHARAEEKRTGNITTVPVLRKIMQGSDEYLTTTPFPEKALELFDSVVTFHAEQGGSKAITEEEVQIVLSEKTGISLSSMGEVEKVKLSDLENLMHEELVGQRYPISLIAKAIRAKTAGVINNTRPIGSFLFLGPTGVGKTETAKVLARVYFGESRVMRFDMAEYSGFEGLERLIGNASTNTPGTLTSALQKQPAGLLLLDEIEKATPAIFNLFLSLLDEGHITDAFGKTISARHTFVVATSNAGSEYIRSLVGQSVEGEEMQKKVLNHVLEAHLFSPEFLNRFDGVVVYQPLTEEELMGVAHLMLSGVATQMKEKGINLSFEEEVYVKVAHDGYDPALGARPMRRTIELSIGDLLAQSLLKGEIKPGDTILLSVDPSTGNFVLKQN